MTPPELILHHYPQSPVSEKVRIVLGMKGLAWRSVEIPRLPPKPLYYPLTGGYRRTPALQIGADVYCDSRCIIDELERRFPEPSLTPGGGQGMIWGAGQWTDGPLFDLVLRIVFAATADDMPDAFVKDRGQLYFGDPAAIPAFKQAMSENLAQLRGQLAWIDARLSQGRAFIPGDAAGIPDALCYYLIWLLQDRWPGTAAFLQEFPHLAAWAERVRAIGHGRATDLSAEEALDIARDASPTTAEQADPADPLGLKPGDRVAIRHHGAGDDAPVVGRLIAGGPDRLVLAPDAGDLGDLAVHFPRVGYSVEKR